MVAVAQLVEHRIVIPVVAGSSPVSHPIFPTSRLRPSAIAVVRIAVEPVMPIPTPLRLLDPQCGLDLLPDRRDFCLAVSGSGLQVSRHRKWPAGVARVASDHMQMELVHQISDGGEVDFLGTPTRT